MSRNSKNNNNKTIGCRELVEYRHSYHCFLSKTLPQYLPPPSTVPPPPSISRPSSVGGLATGNVDLHLLNLDPLNWKKQDHYLLLGLQDKRYKATEADIKAGYRSQSLLYHPDRIKQQKQASSSEKLMTVASDDAIFKCVNQAYQILSDPTKRKQFDAVDSQAFDDAIPAEDAVAPGNVEMFLQVYRHVFTMNARFSKQGSVPDIGHEFSPREDVESFYAFWSTFESWRTFDYFDEDDNACDPENRADKRWMEKKNKANRLKRKNEDNARLRKLFEQAYRLDPRMSRFKEEDRLRKEALKLEKGMNQLRLAEQKKREKEEEEKRKEEATKEAARMAAELKKEKDLVGTKLRKEKKALRDLIVGNLYFIEDRTNIALMSERSIVFEKFLLKCPSYEQTLQKVTSLIDSGSKSIAFDLITLEYQILYGITPTITAIVTPTPAPTPTPTITPIPTSESKPISTPVAEPTLESTPATADITPPTTAITPSVTDSIDQKWTLVEIDALIKAVKSHPGGLRDRWVKITEWYNRHIGHLNDSTLSSSRTVEELIKRAGELRQTADEGTPSQAVSSDAQTDYKSLQRKRDPRIDQALPTVFVCDDSTPTTTPMLPLQWTPEEQKLLEAGLKMYKADQSDRWDNIATHVGKPKKDCMLRAKEIAQILKMKKENNKV